MKWCVQFPEETILIVRPCLVAICMENRPAAKLLHALLYRYSLRLENKDDADNINELKRLRGEKADQDITYIINRKQRQLVGDMCGEITEKTLHNVAVPWLQLLGYLDIEEDLKSNRYILHVDRVTDALNRYDSKKQFTPELEKFLIESFQLEKFLITSEEIKVAIANKKNFSLQLEKVLIGNRNISNCQRGRKPNPEARSKGKSEKPRLDKDTLKKEVTYGDETVAPQPILSCLSSEEKVIPDVDKLSPKPTTSKQRVRKEQTIPSKKAEPLLSEKARAVWEVWLQMPWNKDMAPDLTETAAKHCEKLSTVEITVDIMFKIRNFANKNDNNGFYKGKAWTLGNVVSEYSKWKSSEYAAIGSDQASQAPKMTIADLALVPFRSQTRH